MSVKEELTELELNEAKRCMVRSKGKFIEQGEKPIHYFLNLEKR